MNISKVALTEYDGGHTSIGFEIDTAELSVEEFAELRCLIDLCRILEERNPYSKQPDDQHKTVIRVTTKDGLHEGFFDEEMPLEVSELIELLKTLEQSHSSLEHRAA